VTGVIVVTGGNAENVLTIAVRGYTPAVCD